MTYRMRTFHGAEWAATNRLPDPDENTPPKRGTTNA